jgi:NADH:ubiquinone oxidoreductase subunit F (NADH-binding)
MRGIDADVVDGACHGMCAAGIVVEVRRDGWPALTFTGLTKDAVPDFLAALIHDKPPLTRFHGLAWNEDGWRGLEPASLHRFFGGQRRSILERCGHLDPASVDDAILDGGYAALGEVLDHRTPDDVIEHVKAFGAEAQRMAAKDWEAWRSAPSNEYGLVVSASEGTPGVFVDRHLIEGDPHRVLEGLLIAAYAAGVSRATIRLDPRARVAAERMARAIAHARAAGLVGDRVLGSRWPVAVAIEQGPAHLDARALASSVATLASLPSLMMDRDGGSDAQKRVDGSERANRVETRLWSVSGAVERPGLVEMDGSATVREVLAVTGRVGDDGRDPRVHFVGPSGTPLTAESLDAQADELALSGAHGLIVERANR